MLDWSGNVTRTATRTNKALHNPVSNPPINLPTKNTRTLEVTPVVGSPALTLRRPSQGEAGEFQSRRLEWERELRERILLLPVLEKSGIYWPCLPFFSPPRLSRDLSGPTSACHLVRGRFGWFPLCIIQVFPVLRRGPQVRICPLRRWELFPGDPLFQVRFKG